MASQVSFAGVDVSKSCLDLFQQRMKKSRRFSNDPRGIASLLSTLDASALSCVAVESTGGYERPLLHAMLDARVPVALVNPLNVRHFARGMGYLAKTDALDAVVLADYARNSSPAADSSSMSESCRKTSFSRRSRPR